jgi:hypothetical protein
MDILKSDPFDTLIPDEQYSEAQHSALSGLSEQQKLIALEQLNQLFVYNLEFIRNFARLQADDFPPSVIEHIYALEREVFRTPIPNSKGERSYFRSDGLGLRDERGRRTLSINQRQLIFELTRHPIGRIPALEILDAAEDTCLAGAQITQYLHFIQSNGIPGLIDYWLYAHQAFREWAVEEINEVLRSQYIPVRLTAGGLKDSFCLISTQP